MLTVILQDKLPSDTPYLDHGQSSERGAAYAPGDFFSPPAHQLTVRFFAKHPAALSFHEQRLKAGTLGVFAGKLSGNPSQNHAQAFLAHPEYQVLQDYDPQVAQQLATRPQPLYHATSGLPSWKISALIDAQLNLLDSADIPEAIPSELRQVHSLPAASQALMWLHHPQTDSEHQQALDYLRFREALTLGAVLAKLRRSVRSRPADALPIQPLDSTSKKPGMWQDFLEALPFSLTEGQKQVWGEIAADLARPVPMNRLLQGEVGAGKTVVAILAAWSAVVAGKQAALLAPTEVLAQQHFQTVRKLLAPLIPESHPGDSTQGEVGEALPPGESKESVYVELLTASTPRANRQEILSRLAAGEPLIVIGTHALLSAEVKFSQLAVVIVDEQHRFGVEQRIALSQGLNPAPHLLAMTATPIPRTVAMTVFGDLDVSTLAQRPAGRGEVETILVPEAKAAWVSRVWTRAAEEIARGGRVFVLCPKISPAEEDTPTAPAEPSSSPSSLEILPWEENEVEDLAAGRQLHTVIQTVQRLQSLPIFADIGIGQVHSGLDAAAKQQAIADFAQGRKPLLVCTTVIEVGMDVPSASMMIILDADRFGLSQLHQLRGRIGRGELAGLCLAIAPLDMPAGIADLLPEAAQGGISHPESGSTLSAELSPALARLQAFASTNDGFALAQADLRIRREGDVLGAKQSGRHSQLQILSLLDDGLLIEQAKEAAARLVESDPQLQEHPELARLVFRLGNSAGNLVKA